jgi:hypothetical protein
MPLTHEAFFLPIQVTLNETISSAPLKPHLRLGNNSSLVPFEIEKFHDMVPHLIQY